MFDKPSNTDMPPASIPYLRLTHYHSLAPAYLVVSYFICVRYLFCIRICHDAFSLSALSCCRRHLPAYHRYRQPRRNEPKVTAPPQHVLILFYTKYAQSSSVQEAKWVKESRANCFGHVVCCPQTWHSHSLWVCVHSIWSDNDRQVLNVLIQCSHSMFPPTLQYIAELWQPPFLRLDMFVAPGRVHLKWSSKTQSCFQGSR